MKKRVLLFLLCILSLLTMVSGQDTTGYEHRPFQFTFLFPPLSTNGLNNIHIVNDFSLNLFVGMSGGVGAFEAGGFINIDRYDVRGLQLAGFGNMVGGDLSGVQLAGFFNVNSSSARGLQGAGFINLAGERVTGFQGAGFINMAGTGMEGAQAAGFINLSGGRAKGFQGAGFINVAGELEGVQAAGFINVAGKVKGAQIAGFINVCDSIDGIPLSFINVVKQNGYRRFGVSVSEVQFANLFFKMGVRHFYNIYSFGKAFGPGNRWMYGGGVGTRIDLAPGRMLIIEGTVHQELWIGEPAAPRFLHFDRLNLYNSVKFLLGLSPGERVEVQLGPTFNLSVAHTSPDRGVLEWNPIAPYTLIDWTRNNLNRSTVQFWIGLQGSISL